MVAIIMHPLLMFTDLSLSVSYPLKWLNMWRISLLCISYHCKHKTNENNRQLPFLFIYLFFRDENIHIVYMCYSILQYHQKKNALRNLNTLNCNALLATDITYVTSARELALNIWESLIHSCIWITYFATTATGYCPKVNNVMIQNCHFKLCFVIPKQNYLTAGKIELSKYECCIYNYTLNKIASAFIGKSCEFNWNCS